LKNLGANGKIIIKMALQNLGWEFDYIDLTQNRDR
jgi:hypothetical protein